MGLQKQADDFFGTLQHFSSGHAGFLQVIVDKLSSLENENKELRNSLKDYVHRNELQNFEERLPAQTTEEILESVKSELNNLTEEDLKSPDFNLLLQRLLAKLRPVSGPETEPLESLLNGLLSGEVDKSTETISEADAVISELLAASTAAQKEEEHEEDATVLLQQRVEGLEKRVQELEERNTSLTEKIEVFESERPVELTKPEEMEPTDDIVDSQAPKDIVEPPSAAADPELAKSLESKVDQLAAEVADLKSSLQTPQSLRPSPKAPVIKSDSPEEEISGDGSPLITRISDLENSVTLLLQRMSKPGDASQPVEEEVDPSYVEPIVLGGTSNNLLERIQSDVSKLQREMQSLQTRPTPTSPISTPFSPNTAQAKKELKSALADSKDAPNVEIIFDHFALTQNLQNLNGRVASLENELSAMQSQKQNAEELLTPRPVISAPEERKVQSPTFSPTGACSVDDLAELRAHVSKVKLALTNRIDELRVQMVAVDVGGTPQENLDSMQTHLLNEIKSLQTQLKQKADVDSIELLQGTIKGSHAKVVKKFLALMSEKVDRSNLDLLVQSIDDVKSSIRTLTSQGDLLTREGKDMKDNLTIQKKKLIDLLELVEKLSSKKLDDSDGDCIDDLVNLQGVLEQLKTQKRYISQNAKSITELRKASYMPRTVVSKRHPRTVEEAAPGLEDLKQMLESKASKTELAMKADLHYLNNVMERLAADLLRRMGQGDHALFSGKILDPFKCMSCDRPLQSLPSEANLSHARNFTISRFSGPYHHSQEQPHHSSHFDDSAIYHSNSQTLDINDPKKKAKKRVKSEHHLSLPDLHKRGAV